MAKSSRRAPAAQSQVSKSETGWQDIYVGHASALIAEGHVTADQLPGLPGRNKTVASFRADGSPSLAGKKGVLFSDGYKQVFLKPNGLYKVVIWVGEVERARRAEVAMAAAKAARFGVLREGDGCVDVTCGEVVRIHSEYDFYAVLDGDSRVGRHGYIFENSRGRFFAPAGLLWSVSGRPPYLQLVRSANDKRSPRIDRRPDLRLVSSTNVQRAPIML